MDSLFKKPTAWVPIALSLAMMIVEYLYLFGVVPQGPVGDEGTAAHLFQIWFVLEIILVPVFATLWLPRRTRPALGVLAVQVILFLVVCFPIFYLQL